MIALTTAPLDPGVRLARFCAERTDIGAVVSFTGLCRAEPAMQGLELEAYPGFTEDAIRRQAEDTRARFGLLDLDVVHRVGRVGVGEPIVFLATAARHRRAAFEGADQLMDYLKSRAPFWKKAIGAAGDRWIEPRAEDFEDAARWDAGVEKEARR